jgi:hypothetical protein
MSWWAQGKDKTPPRGGTWAGFEPRRGDCGAISEGKSNPHGAVGGIHECGLRPDHNPPYSSRSIRAGVRPQRRRTGSRTNRTPSLTMYCPETSLPVLASHVNSIPLEGFRHLTLRTRRHRRLFSSPSEPYCGPPLGTLACTGGTFPRICGSVRACSRAARIHRRTGDTPPRR